MPHHSWLVTGRHARAHSPRRPHAPPPPRRLPPPPPPPPGWPQEGIFRRTRLSPICRERRLVPDRGEHGVGKHAVQRDEGESDRRALPRSSATRAPQSGV